MFHCTVRYVTPLCDAWVEANGVDGGETSETPSNSYTHRFVQGEICWLPGSGSTQKYMDIRGKILIISCKKKKILFFAQTSNCSLMSDYLKLKKYK